MSTVVKFSTYKNIPRCTLSDRVTKAVLADFPEYSPAAIEAGIAEGNRIIASGGTYSIAYAAARGAVLRAVCDRNAQRLAEFYVRRAIRTETSIRAIEHMLRKSRAPHEIQPAIERARRVLDGGGTFHSALRHACRGES